MASSISGCSTPSSAPRTRANGWLSDERFQGTPQSTGTPSVADRKAGTMRTPTIHVSSTVIALMAAACGEPQLAAELNEQLAKDRMSSTAPPVTSDQSTPGQQPTLGEQPGAPSDPSAAGGQPSPSEGSTNPEAPPAAVFVPPTPGADEPG